MNTTEIKRFVTLCKKAGVKPSHIAKRQGLSLTSLKHYLATLPASSLKSTLETIEEIEEHLKYLKIYLETRYACELENPKPRAKRGRPKNK
jgi:hypothetical protein